MDFMTIAAIICGCIYLILNLVTAGFYRAEKMKAQFVTGQCLTGKILLNLFYAPAWILKGIRYLIVMSIA